MFLVGSFTIPTQRTTNRENTWRIGQIPKKKSAKSQKGPKRQIGTDKSKSGNHPRLAALDCGFLHKIRALGLPPEICPMLPGPWNLFFLPDTPRIEDASTRVYKRQRALGYHVLRSPYMKILSICLCNTHTSLRAQGSTCNVTEEEDEHQHMHCDAQLYFKWAHRLYSFQELPIIHGRKSHIYIGGRKSPLKDMIQWGNPKNIRNLNYGTFFLELCLFRLGIISCVFWLSVMMAPFNRAWAQLSYTSFKGPQKTRKPTSRTNSTK